MTIHQDLRRFTMTMKLRSFRQCPLLQSLAVSFLSTYLPTENFWKSELQLKKKNFRWQSVKTYLLWLIWGFFLRNPRNFPHSTLRLTKISWRLLLTIKLTKRKKMIPRTSNARPRRRRRTPFANLGRTHSNCRFKRRERCNRENSYSSKASSEVATTRMRLERDRAWVPLIKNDFWFLFF